MSYQWHLAGRPSLSEISSSYTPVPAPTLFQNAIPVGTVRSRVAFLQNLANPGSTPAAPPPASSHLRETSRSGFGRRLNNRFGLPALQNTKPDEQPHFDTTHSFLGLTTPRTHHNEEHGSAKIPERYGRSPGINGRMVPVGIMERVQQDAVSPWGVRPQTTLSRSGPWQRSRDQGTNDEKLDFGRPTCYTSLNFTLPTPHDESIELWTLPDLKSNARRTSTDQTAITTSTSRRQSARDLFADHGMVFPDELATSREMSHETATAQEDQSHRYCHECSWINSSRAAKCWRCGHLLCRDCENLAPQPLQVSKKQDGNSLIGEGRSVSVSPLTQTRVAHQDSTRFESRRKQDQRPPTGTTREFPPQQPSAASPQSSTSKRLRLKDPQRPHTTIRPQEAATQRAQAQLEKETKRARLSGARGLQAQSRLQPSTSNIQAGAGRRSSNEQQSKVKCLIDDSSIFPGATSCGSPACSVTHRGHEPYRHAASCPCKQPKRRGNSDVADASSVHENPLSLGPSRSRHSDAPSYTRTHSDGLTPRPLSCVTRLQESAIELRLPSPPEIPEYVECHGYPRTGHAHHRSPVSAGVVGECQHCLDDCQCAACQNTPHNVRCCMHRDHQTIVHLHHTPQKQSPELERCITLKTTSPTADASSDSPPSSHHDSTTTPDPQLSYHYPGSAAAEKATNLTSWAGDRIQSRPGAINKAWKDSSHENKSSPSNLAAVGSGPILAGNRLVTATSKPTKYRNPGSRSMSTPATIKHVMTRSEVAESTETMVTVNSEPKHSHDDDTRKKSCTSLLKSSLGLGLKGKYSSSRTTKPPTPPQKRFSISSSRKSSKVLSTLFQERELCSSPFSFAKTSRPSNSQTILCQYVNEKCYDIATPANYPTQTAVRDFATAPELLARRIQNCKPSSPSSSTNKPRGSRPSKFLARQFSSDCGSDGAELSREEHMLENDIDNDEEIEQANEFHARGLSSIARSRFYRDNVGEEEGEEDGHVCKWKLLYMDGRRDFHGTRLNPKGEEDLDIRGMTIIVRLEGREDLVAEVGSWRGGVVKLGGSGAGGFV